MEKIPRNKRADDGRCQPPPRRTVGRVQAQTEPFRYHDENNNRQSHNRADYQCDDEKELILTLPNAFRQAP